MLFETLTSCIQIWICREFHRNNYLIQYKINYNNLDVTYKGPYILNIEERLRYIPQYLVAEGDFTSLYPTVIIQHNISPELLQDGNEDPQSINLNYGTDK